MQNYSTIIVGGGVMGCSIAFHLAKAGVEDILVLDKGPLASGTTPWAAGQTASLTSHGSAMAFTLYCGDFIENFEAKTGYPIDFVQSGSLRIALTEPYLRNLTGYVEAAAEVGDGRVQMLSLAETRERVPDLNLPDSTAGVLWNGGDGYVDPKSVALGYAAGAKDKGVAFKTHTPVEALIVLGGVARGVKTAAGPIWADRVIVAAGAWSRQLLSEITSGRDTDTLLDLNLPSVPVRHQAYVTAPFKVVDLQMPIVRLIEPQIYVRPHAGGMLVGGYGYRPTSYDMSSFPAEFEIGMLPPNSVSYAELKIEAEKYFPILKDQPIAQERHGLPTVSPDGGLILSGYQAAAGLFVASGCEVSGIAYSPGIGKVMADTVLTGRSDLAPDGYEHDRFSQKYQKDGALRARCEKIYGTMYWGASAYSHLGTE